MCNAKESNELMIWAYDEIGKTNWDLNDHKTFKANQPLCDNCVKKMFPEKR